MLTKVERSELTRCRHERSPLRLFADKTANEFVDKSGVGDIYEVTGAPIQGSEKDIQRLAEALRSALFYLEDGKNMRKEVRVITRGGKRVFLERLAPEAKHRRPVSLWE